MPTGKNARDRKALALRQGRFTYLEAGRGLAAIAVTLAHVANFVYGASVSTPHYIMLLALGRTGVDFFFVLSGFIILYVHYEDIGCPDRLRYYLASRISRVLPTYWIALAVTCLIRGFPSGGDVVRSMLFLPTAHAIVYPFYLPPAWTLQYEMLFYAAFLVLILNNRLGGTLFFVWTAWIAIAGITDLGDCAPFTGFYNVEFFGGMAVAWIARNVQVPAPRAVIAAGVLVFGLQLMIEGSMPIGPVTVRPLYGLGAMLIVLGIVESERRIGGTTQRPLLQPAPASLQALGRGSYSIYLFHQPLIMLLAPLWIATGLPAIASVIPITMLIVAVSLLISRRVEYPLIGLVRRLIAPAPRRPVTATAAVQPLVHS